MRCPGCNKFPGYNDPEVEDESAEISDDGEQITLTGTVKLTSSCCSEDLKSAEIEITEDVAIPEGHAGEEHDLSIETEVQGTSKSEGKGRGARTFYGVQFNWTINCSCVPTEPLLTGESVDYVQASHMDELV